MGYCGFFVLIPSVNDRQSFLNKERLLPNGVIYVDIRRGNEDATYSGGRKKVCDCSGLQFTTQHRRMRLY